MQQNNASSLEQGNLIQIKERKKERKKERPNYAAKKCHMISTGETDSKKRKNKRK